VEDNIKNVSCTDTVTD